MKRIVFDGWKEGFLKVSSAHLFQRHFNLSIREAKEKTDRLLDRKVFALSIDKTQDPEGIVKEFSKIGALCHLEE